MLECIAQRPSLPLAPPALTENVFDAWRISCGNGGGLPQEPHLWCFGAGRIRNPEMDSLSPTHVKDRPFWWGWHKSCRWNPTCSFWFFRVRAGGEMDPNPQLGAMRTEDSIPILMKDARSSWPSDEGLPTVDERNPFRTALKPWERKSVRWYLQELHESWVSLESAHRSA